MFELLVTESFAKNLKKLEKSDVARIKAKIFLTLDEPRLFWVGLTGNKLFKLRIGKFRVVSSIDFPGKRLTLLSVGLRKNVYDSLPIA